MKLVTFQTSQGVSIGAIHSGGFVVDFAGLGSSFPATMHALIEAGDEPLMQARRWVERAAPEARLSLDDVRLLAPLPRPVRIRDGLLMLEHLEAAFAKMGMPLHPEIRRQAIYVNSDTAHVFGPGDEIPFPMDTDWMDYELEWACVIGKKGIAVEREEARRHIFGFTIFNDWSARDLQKPEKSLGLGFSKGKDFANTLGPYLVTADEVEDRRDADGFLDLEMTVTLNGELIGRDTLAHVSWTFEEMIAYATRDAWVRPGDILGSGTCGWGALAEFWGRLGERTPPPLMPGDVVTLAVERLGTLRNTVVPGRTDAYLPRARKRGHTPRP